MALLDLGHVFSPFHIEVRPSTELWQSCKRSKTSQAFNIEIFQDFLNL